MWKSRRETIQIIGAGLVGAAGGYAIDSGLPNLGAPVDLYLGNVDEQPHDLQLTVLDAGADEYSSGIVFRQTFRFDANSEDKDPQREVSDAFPSGRYLFEVNLDQELVEHYQFVPDCANAEKQNARDGVDTAFIYITDGGRLRYEQTECRSNDWRL